MIALVNTHDGRTTARNAAKRACRRCNTRDAIKYTGTAVREKMAALSPRARDETKGAPLGSYISATGKQFRGGERDCNSGDRWHQVSAPQRTTDTTTHSSLTITELTVERPGRALIGSGARPISPDP